MGDNTDDLDLDQTDDDVILNCDVSDDALEVAASMEWGCLTVTLPTDCGTSALHCC